MAKKKKSNTKKAKVNQEIAENALPQNIMPVGERVEYDKKIYISQKVYKEIQKFTKNKLTNESGGMLVGKVIEEFGKANIVIDGFVEAKHCEATPTTLKFTHETWEYVHREIDKKFPGEHIVGWIHTHPNFGIFLSEYDKFIHSNFFSQENQIAYVVDPIQKTEGFYFWINGKIERCVGFYVYDKTGVEIDVDTEGESSLEATGAREPMFSFKNIIIALLVLAVLALGVMNIQLNGRVKNLEREQAAMAEQIEAISTFDFGPAITSIIQSMIFGEIYEEENPGETETTAAQDDASQ